MPEQLQQHTTASDRFAAAVARLEQLRGYTGTAKGFWQSYLTALAEIAAAQSAVLLHAGPKDASSGWKRVIAWPGENLISAAERQFISAAGDLAEACVQHGGVFRSRPANLPVLGECRTIAVRLASVAEQETWVAGFLLVGVTDAAAEQAARQLQIASHFPAIYQVRQDTAQSEVALSHLASVLDLVALLNSHSHFMPLAMALCNEIAARHRCDRVSLGWLKGEYVRVAALSHTEKFDRKVELIQALESAMEESLDQDEILLCPPPEEQHLVTRDHERFSKSQASPHVCSLPLRVEGGPVAVLTCERASEPFHEVEVRLLSLCGEMSSRRLYELRKTDRWFGARWLDSGREAAAMLVGHEHTGPKLIGLVVAIALGILLFGKGNYRVDAPFTVRTAQTALISAPFAGFIEEVHVEPGDTVATGATLLTLDSRELLLQEASAAADQARFSREAEKAQAADKLAEARIAEAQADQARAKLGLVRFHRNQAEIKAPFDGVVVEGDLKRRLGAPVKDGDLLMKFGRTDQLFVECDVSERDLHEVKVGSRGEIAFASLPQYKFPIEVERIIPLATPKESGNVFTVRCRLTGPVQDWWRPGMTGVSKLEAGRRTYAWMLLHRTIDYLRITLWK